MYCKVFCVLFLVNKISIRSFLIIVFGTFASRERYTIFETASVLKISILPSNKNPFNSTNKKPFLYF